MHVQILFRVIYTAIYALTIESIIFFIIFCIIFSYDNFSFLVSYISKDYSHFWTYVSCRKWKIKKLQSSYSS